MDTKDEILESIKSTIKEIVPDANIILFGSRARGDWHEESDWDILVLTKNKVSKDVEKKIHDKLFMLSVQIASFINILIVYEEDWEQSPSYYSLYQSVSEEGIQI
ncbi:MAG TPA: nucleotidyltransferase domain-containing protein [Chitinophagaceae bacterium]|nr:nucleotidyltransferase domain-containing protein [Chitinophagaceae bacterium]